MSTKDHHAQRAAEGGGGDLSYRKQQLREAQRRRRTQLLEEGGRVLTLSLPAEAISALRKLENEMSTSEHKMTKVRIVSEVLISYARGSAPVVNVGGASQGEACTVSMENKDIETAAYDRIIRQVVRLIAEVDRSQIGSEDLGGFLEIAKDRCLGKKSKSPLPSGQSRLF